MIEMREEKTISGQRVTTRALTESALLIAAATVLSLIKIFEAPYGGSVTLGSMIPIILISLKYPFSWSLTTALAYALIQMLFGFYAPPVENFIYYSLMVYLDYLIAFGVLSLAGPLYRAMKDSRSARVRMMTAAIICFILRFVCHFVSGIIIWNTYAPEGQPVWLYSLLYNGSYMLCECLISGVILFVAGQKLADIFIGNKS